MVLLPATKRKMGQEREKKKDQGCWKNWGVQKFAGRFQPGRRESSGEGGRHTEKGDENAAGDWGEALQEAPGAVGSHKCNVYELYTDIHAKYCMSLHSQAPHHAASWGSMHAK